MVSEANKLCVVTRIAWSATTNGLLRGAELVVLFITCADVEVVACADVEVVACADVEVVAGANVVVVLVTGTTVVVLLVILVVVLVVGANEVVLLFIIVLVMYVVVLVEVCTLDVSIWFGASFFSNCDGNTVYAPFVTTKFPVTVIVLPITAKVGSLGSLFPAL